VKIVQVNVEATMRITHKVLDCRAEKQPFYIVFVSSLASFYPMPLKATYAASKSFLREFACALGQELRPLGVRVTTLCPGGLSTTDEALSGIEAQGFWGDVTTNPLETAFNLYTGFC
jgi:short-subunit dehydrogenase